MTSTVVRELPPGTIVEFFESKEVLCGVCLTVKSMRLAVLTEQNREINLAQSRVLHAGTAHMDVRLDRDELVRRLVRTAALRKSMSEAVNLEELWSLLEGEEENYDAGELAGFLYSEALTDDHVAAVQRALFQDRLFFQFKDGRFQARSAEKVELRRTEMEREREREAELETSAQWIQGVWNRKARSAVPDELLPLTDKLKSFALFGQESPQAVFMKEVFRRANVPGTPQSAFRLLVRVGIWTEDENLFLHEQNISAEFSPGIEEEAVRLASGGIGSRWNGSGRTDLRELPVFTVDSATTRDYDDALSLRPLDGGLFEVGIHIADAAEFIEKGSPLEVEAMERTTSIYLPDGKIPMLPPSISEGLCSLIAGEDRLAVSFLLTVDETGSIRESQIVPSVVRVKRQLTYEDINEHIDAEPGHRLLHELALKFREQRLARGAIILPLPEIQVHVNPASGMIQLSKYEKETPSQILVSEWMIAANGAAAATLAEKGVPAVFRAQGECRPETDFTHSDHEIFRIYRQRRLFARAEIDVKAGRHCSLGMEHYTTVTSPIRRYTDLVVQRQLKHFLATGTPFYSEEEMKDIIVQVGTIQPKIAVIQRKWSRYWMLKYIEQEDIQTLDALVLDSGDRFAHLLLPEFLIETNVLLTDKTRVPPGEMIRVKVDRVNPREDVIRVLLPDFFKQG